MTPWEELFVAEVKRLRQFYSIEIARDDFREVQQWLRDRFELRPADDLCERLNTLPPTEMRQLRYDFVQFVKWLRRTKSSQANARPQLAKAAHTLDETRERDHSLE